MLRTIYIWGLEDKRVSLKEHSGTRKSGYYIIYKTKERERFHEEERLFSQLAHIDLVEIPLI